jgi:hypothetical protein
MKNIPLNKEVLNARLSFIEDSIRRLYSQLSSIAFMSAKNFFA